MRWFLFFLTFLSCSGGPSQTFSIGIDPSFSPATLGRKQDYVRGYVEDFLMALSKQSGKSLQKMISPPGSLLTNLEKGKYQAVLSSIEPYNFYLDKYDFSEGFLQVGMVLVVLENSSVRSLEDLKKEALGFIEGAFPSFISEKLPEKVIIKTYPTYADLLDGVEKGEIEGAILERLPALSFLEDTFHKKLRVIEKPVLDRQIRLVTMKGKERNLIRYFNEINKKQKKEKLLKKWLLSLRDIRAGLDQLV